MTGLRKKLFTFAKIAISAILVYFIFTKVNFGEVVDIIKRTNLLLLIPALILFIISKVLAAFRLNLYFHQIGANLTHKSNLKLYLLGMFYNLFLPGGIGGDAYKGYLIKKYFKVDTKKVVSVLVLDRLSGLLLLFLYACILAMSLKLDLVEPYGWLIWFVGIASIFTFWLLNRKFFEFVFPIFWKSFLLSALVQLAQLICVGIILKALAITANTIAYLFIFLISSIVSVIPMTIGGIGSRELTFFYGANLFSLDENASISISMLFFLCTALVSFFGIIYHFNKIKLNLKP